MLLTLLKIDSQTFFQISFTLMQNYIEKKNANAIFYTFYVWKQIKTT